MDKSAAECSVVGLLSEPRRARLTPALIQALDYVPDLEPGVWEQVRPFVAEVLDGLDIERASYAKTTVRAAARFAAYAVTLGRDATVDDALEPDLVESYIAVQRKKAKTSGVGLEIVASEGSRLRVIGRTLRPRLPWPVVRERSAKRPLLPLYTPRQYQDFLAAARALRDDDTRRVVFGVLALGLGAGVPGGNMRRVRTDDVHVDHTGTTWVTVRGADDRACRTVPVAGPWDTVLADAIHLAIASQTADGFVVPYSPRASGLSDRLTNIARRNPALDIDPHRLRTTWLAERMHAGVPLHTLLTYAGLTSAETLVQIAALAQPQPFDDAIAAMTREVTA